MDSFNWKSFALLAFWSVLAQPVGNAASGALTSVDAQVAQGKAELAKGQLNSAISTLGKAAQILGTKPGSCECHLNLGIALSKRAKSEGTTNAAKSTADYRSAKKELRTAIRVGQGNAVSKKANEVLMSNIPANILSPRSGEGTEMIAARLGLRSVSRGLGATVKPKVYEFYAAWCQPCKDMKLALAKAMLPYGNQVDVESIDVDDKNNAEMVDQYDISPIPTVIYMDTEGKVVGYSVGFAGELNVQKELQKILPNKT